MKTIGRNDPCPCGSGKKYKKCCGAVSRVGDSDFQYANIRRLDGESGNLLMRFAKQRYGENALENAWGEFFFSDEIPYDMSHPEFDFFLRWFTFDWRPQENETLAELFLSQKSGKPAATSITSSMQLSTPHIVSGKYSKPSPAPE